MHTISARPSCAVRLKSPHRAALYPPRIFIVDNYAPSADAAAREFNCRHGKNRRRPDSHRGYTLGRFCVRAGAREIIRLISRRPAAIKIATAIGPRARERRAIRDGDSRRIVNTLTRGPVVRGLISRGVARDTAAMD